MTSLLDETNNDDQIVEPKSYLEEIAGPGKKFDKTKYKSDDEWKEAVSRGKYEADRTLTFKLNEMDKLREDYLKLREDYNSRAKLEEIRDQILKLQQPTSHENTSDVKEDKPVFDPEQVKSLVSTQYRQEIEAGKREENFNSVMDKLQQRYGSNYKNVVKQQIDELGITVAELDEMARRQPKVLIRTLGLDQTNQQESFQAPPKSSQRSDGFAPATQKRTWAYYEKMRKEKPRDYYDGKTQVQLMQDRATLGKEFEDGDWNALG